MTDIAIDPAAFPREFDVASDGSPVALSGTAANVIRHDPENGCRIILVANPQGIA